LSAVATSTSEASRMRCSSPHGVGTISWSSTWTPSASDSIEATIQPSVAAAERPVLRQRDDRARGPLPHDRRAVQCLDPVAQSRGDPDRHAVVRRALAVDEPEVFDRVHAQHLDAVVPAAFREVVEPAAPLHQQIGIEQLGEPSVVARVPRRLRRPEDPLGRLHDHVRGEQRIVIRRLGRGQLDLAPPRFTAFADLSHLQPAEQHERQEGDDDHEEEEWAPAARTACAAAAVRAAASAPTPAEAGRTATGRREHRRECEHHHAVHATPATLGSIRGPSLTRSGGAKRGTLDVDGNPAAALDRRSRANARRDGRRSRSDPRVKG